MRAIALTIVVFGLLPLILYRPYVGVLVWSWLGYMNPHKFAYGFATQMPYAFIVAITTLIALLVSKEPKRIPWTRETILLAVLIVWMFMTTVFSLYPWLAWEQWDKVWRVMLMTYVTMLLINNEHRIKVLVLVISLSLGFFGVKGGFFVLQTGGAHRVMGPSNSFIGDNNAIGLALIMTVPLLHFVLMQARKLLHRLAIAGGIGSTMIAIIGTHSRGALVGSVAMLLFFLFKSRRKFIAVISMVPLLWALYAVMPEKWFDRMETIETWEQDGSASERVRAWGNAINLASVRLIGGGMRALVHWGGRDSHSIYFGMLGEHGWIGLAMFLLLLFFTWRSASWVIRQCKGRPELDWARDLSAMAQVSLVGYMSAGAFLGLQYFDLFYHLVAIVVMTRVVVTGHVAQTAAAPAVATARPRSPPLVHGRPVAQRPT